MRVQAIRASETFLARPATSHLPPTTDTHEGRRSRRRDLALLTLNLFKVPDIADVVKGAGGEQGARRDRDRQLDRLPRRPWRRGRGRTFTPEQDLMDKGGAIFGEICFTCHGPDGRGAPLAGADPA